MTRERTKFKVIKLNELDNLTIDHLKRVLAFSENSTPFHDPELNKFISVFFSLESYVIIALDGDEIYGFIICHKKQDDSLITSPYQLSLLTYGGPVSLPGKDHIITDLLRKLKKNFLKDTIYIKSGYKIPTDLYRKSGYRIQTIPTLLIDTDRSEQLIWDGFDNRIRRNIKKAIKHNIEVIIENERYLEQFAYVYKDVCERTGLFFHGPDYYKKLFYTLQNDVKMSIYYAKYNSNIISAMSVLEYKDQINPWFGGTKANFIDTGAGSLIYWEILKHACSGGFRTFDFLGLDIGPIAFYKRGFGGTEIDICHANYSPFLKRAIRKISRYLISH
ncbi:MAG: FemAB family protein [Bacteroidetes bacterium ADurb.Bin145]|nr:MAG: FemAB family protein [Bacteroidetes bacterium ADurb.Bin145]